MGGNALKQVKTFRLNKDDYFSLAEECLNILTNIYPNRKIKIIPSFFEKLDFGDLDILIELKKDNLSEDNGEAVKKAFKSKETYFNNNVRSYEFKNFQVDLVFIGQESFEFAYNYYSYNDLGNLMGKAAKKLRTSYGYKDLYFTHCDNRNKSQLLGKVSLTKNSKTAFDFMGYDFNQLEKGFNNLEEIFEYVVSSPFFSKQAFYWENINHAARIRDKKRKTYNEFLKWLELKNPPDGRYHQIDSNFIYSRLDDFFPELKNQVVLLELDEEKRKLIKSKFNGLIFAELTGYQEKELSEKMKAFKNSIDNFSQWIEIAEINEVNEKIKKFAQKNCNFKKNN